MKMKKVVAVVMALALALINPFTVSDAKAANYSAKEFKELIPYTTDAATAYETKEYNYPISNSRDVVYKITAVSPVDVDVSIKKGNTLASKTFSTSDWEIDNNGMYCCTIIYSHQSSGDYSITLTFHEDIDDYAFEAQVYLPDAKINLKNVAITTGFKRKLSVTGSKVKRWKTNNSSVANVDQKGNVTAKKVGNCTITAELTSGQKLTCKVSVKKNAFYAKKGSNSDGYPGVFYANPYYAEYNSKGDLVLKVRIINNTYQKIAKFKNIKIQVKNPSGKLIGTYSASSKNVSIPSYTCKDLTFVIKKANLKIKIKKADLRNSTVKVLNFDGYYYRYY